MEISERMHFRLLAVLFMALVMASCSNYRDIRLTSCRMERLSPKGLKSVEATIALGFHNPAREIHVEDITGRIYRNGHEIGDIQASPVIVPGRCDSDVDVHARLSLSPTVSLMEVLALSSRFDPDEFTVDFSLKVKVKGGPGKKVHEKDVPLKRFINWSRL